MKRDQTLKSFSHLYLCKTQKSIIVPRQGISAIVSRVVFFLFAAPSGQWTKLNWHRWPLIVFMLRYVRFMLTSRFSPGGKQISFVPLDGSPGVWCRNDPNAGMRWVWTSPNHKLHAGCLKWEHFHLPRDLKTQSDSNGDIFFWWMDGF